MTEYHFSSERLDRQSERRGKGDWISKCLLEPETRLLPVCGQRNLIRQDEAATAVMLSPSEAQEWLSSGALTVFLGVMADRSYFAFEAPCQEELGADGLNEYGTFDNIRTIGAMLPASDAGLLAYARGMIHWHREHRHCGACGTRTKVRQAGHLRVCSSLRCGREHFPRTDPAIIVRVDHGDRCLLGRQDKWPRLWFSVLAGFVEPGESLEAAVRREVLEETGVRVSEVIYHSSQPWPFPASLMVGFTARAASDALVINAAELHVARWFTRDELREGLAGNDVRLPPPISISRRLIDDWLET